MESPTVTLELTVEEVNIILGSLQEIPYKTSKDLIDKVITQAQASVDANKVPQKGE